MKNVLIFGANGMLGSSLLKYFSKIDNINLFATTRSGKLPENLLSFLGEENCKPFNACNLDEKQIDEICNGMDLVLNAIGLIKQKINNNCFLDREKSLLINTIFPIKLAKVAKNLGFQVIQIATDCVFSGGKGNYLESDLHDPTDIYGLSKSLGEILIPNFHNIRCSLIGFELNSSFSLLNWFLKQSPGSTLNGFTNHYWNGLTTLHFSKICAGFLSTEINKNMSTHLLPFDQASKYQLLKFFSKYSNRNDILINPIESDKNINRILKTNYKNLNNELWLMGGYTKPPSIEEMIQELFCYEENIQK